MARRSAKARRKGSKKRKTKSRVLSKQVVSRLRTLLAETKKKNNLIPEFALPADDDFTFDGCYLYNCDWVQGDERDQISGRNIHVKYLKTKIRFRFPFGSIERVYNDANQAQQAGANFTIRGGIGPDGVNRTGPIVKATKLEVVWGWIKKPQALATALEHSVGSGMAVHNGNCTKDHYMTTMMDIVKRDFKDNEDRLVFHERRPSLVKYVGRKTIKPQRNNTIEAGGGIYAHGYTALAPAAAGGGGSDFIPEPPEVHTSISWPCNRELKLTRSTRAVGDGQDLLLYNNEGWQPFWLVYNPDRDAARVDVGERIKCRANTQIWYTDS